MAKDSKLWEQAYASYKVSVPDYKKTKHYSKTVSNLQAEPVRLMHDIADITKQIRELIAKKKTLQKQLKSMGDYRPIKSEYFDKPIYLYVLLLETDKWYIGQTRNVDKRFNRHSKGKGAIWTKKYKPIEIVMTRNTNLTSEGEVALLEDELTIEYAKKYGIENVRGGGYCQAKPRWPKEVLELDTSWII